MRTFVARLLLANVLLFGGFSLASAAISPEQRKEATAIQEEVTKAARLYGEQKFKEAGEVVVAVQGRVDKFCETADAQAIKLLDPISTRLVRAHALLELEGVELPPLKKIEAGLVPDKPADKPVPAAGGGISFVKEVAPVLVAKCGNCHVRDAKGKVSMADFASLMKGSATDGVIIFPGDGAGSRLIEVIDSGDMPRGGAKITPAEYALLKKWIDEGAKFDGQSATANLAALTPGTKAEEPTKLEVMEATGKETVSFAKDVAPHLAATCVNCHGGGQQTRAMFNLTTFTGLLKGGDSGPPIVPGKGAESLLVMKLKGMGDGQRMPLNLPPLPDNVIAKIEKWIDEGAKFDGGDANLNVRQVAALAKANSSTHEELMAERAKLAEEKWRLGLPGVIAPKVETKNFLVMGNVGENTLKQIADQAETLVPKVAAILKAPADKPLVKGRMTIYVFDQRYDYAEFGNMVERRELPKSLRGHFFASPVEVYGAVIPSKSGEYAADVLIGQQLAGAFVSNLGKSPPPRWFSEGVARATAAKLADDDARVTEWEIAMPSILSTMASPDDFLTGKLAPEEADICSFSFVQFLMSDSKRFENLMVGLKKGQDFTQTFSTVYGGSPAQATVPWIKKASAKKPPKR